MSSASRNRSCSSVLHRSRGLVMVYGFLAFFPGISLPRSINLSSTDTQTRFAQARAVYIRAHAVELGTQERKDPFGAGTASSAAGRLTRIGGSSAMSRNDGVAREAEPKI